MLAYNKKGLDNLSLQEEAAEALRLKCITTAEKEAIDKAYPSGFYISNLFIKIGIFILTLVVVNFGVGLLSLMALPAMEHETSIGAFLLFVGLLIYGLMEMMIANGRHFHSGLDDALLLMALGYIFSGIYILLAHRDFDVPLLTCSVVTFIVTLAATVRTANILTGLGCFLSILAIVFFGLLKLGVVGQSILPFILMIVSLGLYFLMKRAAENEWATHYRRMLPYLLTAALLTFYIAGNYFAVSTAQAALSNADDYTEVAKPIALGWLFWIFSISVPFIYIYFGIRKKDAILLRTGLILIAAAVFTIRYYHSVLPLEWAMVLGGVLLVGISYWLIRYLKTPKHGFSDEPVEDASRFGRLQLEALLVTQTMQAPTANKGFDFGGGSGGGGGAGGTF